MIKYDYVLETDYNIVKKTFKPSAIPKILPNLVYIEGPNSVGKSSLLHVLALSMYGKDKDTINKALKEKLNQLLYADHQNLTFNVSISNRDDSLEITSIKEHGKDPEIIVREIIEGEKQPPLTPETFHNKYNLIYDIPSNPTERLTQLVYEIEKIQTNQLFKVQRFRHYLRNIIDDIKKGKDPNKIQDIKEKIRILKEKITICQSEMDKKKDLLENIEKYTYCHLYYESLKSLENFIIEDRRLQGLRKKQNRETKKTNKELDILKKELKTLLSELNDAKLEVASQIKSYIPKEKKEVWIAWQNANFDQYVADRDIPTSVKRIILEFERVMENIKKSKIKESGALKEVNVFNEIIDFLEHYRDTNIILPGVEKTIEEFIEILREKNQEYQEAEDFLNDYKIVMTNLHKIDENCRILEKKFVQIIDVERKIGLSGNGDFDLDIDELIESNEKAMKKAENKYEEYEIELHKRELQTDPDSVLSIINEFEKDERFALYINESDDRLINIINGTQREFATLENQFKSDNRTLNAWEHELSILEREEEHPYNIHKDLLENLLKRVIQIESKIDEFNKFIKNVENKKKNVNPTEKEIKYYDAVFSYLARKVGYIRHINDEYKIKKIDMIEEKIYTDNDMIIHLRDMGTGQGQMAYLLGLLNSCDERKIIALFDEVAMMDSTSLNPIFNKFRELYESDRLLVGIVVQKADKVNILSKMEA